MVFQFEVYYKVDRLLTGLTAQKKGTTTRWYSNKTSLNIYYVTHNIKYIDNFWVSLYFQVKLIKNVGPIDQP